MVIDSLLPLRLAIDLEIHEYREAIVIQVMDSVAMTVPIFPVVLSILLQHDEVMAVV